MPVDVLNGVTIPNSMRLLPVSKRGYPVPYVAEWSGEDNLILPPPVHHVFGMVVDTDGKQGDGYPLLGQMQPARQRECMVQNLCQVCHRDLRNKTRFMAGGFTDPMWFTEPPTCLQCMVFAVQVCPGLVAGVQNHNAPLLVRVVKKGSEMEYQQERVGIMNPELVKAGVLVPLGRVNGTFTKRTGDSFLAPYGYRDGISACYFVRGRPKTYEAMLVSVFLSRFT
jgi:hypothetical protein